MSLFYPDTATFTKVTSGGYNPDTGLPNPETTETVTLTGRYDTNVNRFVQRGQDGSFTAPKFVFYMPLGQDNVPLDIELIVNDSSSGIQYRGIVKQFNKGGVGISGHGNAFCLCQ